MEVVTATRKIVEIGDPMTSYKRAVYPVMFDDGNTALYDRVTAVLDVFSKEGLIYWAANEERGFKSWADRGATPRGWWKVARRLADDEYDHDANLDDVIEREIRAEFGTYKNGRVRHAFQATKHEAADIGTMADKWITWSVDKELGKNVGAEPEIPDASMVADNAWLEWRKKVTFKPITTQIRVASQHLEVAGTIDCIALVNGHRVVIDWKTSRKVYPEAHMQVDIYRRMYNEIEGNAATAGIIVWLPKNEGDGTFNVVPVDIGVDHLTGFIGARNALRWRQRMER